MTIRNFEATMGLGLSSPREVEIAAGPHIWIQWKGTNLCADVHCQCGCHSHIDADFAYAIECPQCHQVYVVGTNVTLYPLPAGVEWDGPVIEKAYL